MKINFLILCLLSLLSACNTLSDADAQKQAISRVLYAQQDAWNEGDIDTFLEGYIKSDELRFVSRTGVNKGIAEVKAMYQRGYKNPKEMGHLTFELSEIKLLGEEYATIIGLYMLDFPDQKQRRGRFTLLLTKTPTGWKIIQDHTS